MICPVDLQNHVIGAPSEIRTRTVDLLKIASPASWTIGAYQSRGDGDLIIPRVTSSLTVTGQPPHWSGWGVLQSRPPLSESGTLLLSYTLINKKMARTTGIGPA